MKKLKISEILLFEHKKKHEYIALGLRTGEVIIKHPQLIAKEDEVFRITPDVEHFKKREFRKFAEKQNDNREYLNNVEFMKINMGENQNMSGYDERGFIKHIDTDAIINDT